MRRFMLVLRIMPPTRHARGSDIIFDLPGVPPLTRLHPALLYTALTGSKIRALRAPE